MVYEKTHMILTCGDYVLGVSEELLEVKKLLIMIYSELKIKKLLNIGILWKNYYLKINGKILMENFNLDNFIN